MVFKLVLRDSDKKVKKELREERRPGAHNLSRDEKTLRKNYKNHENPSEDWDSGSGKRPPKRDEDKRTKK